MSGDLEVVVDLGDGTRYAKHWNYNGTSYTINRSGKHLHSATRHEARLVEEILRLKRALAAKKEGGEDA